MSVGDLPAINHIVSACVMGWNLPERVKRLSLASYHYHEHDLDQGQLLIAQDDRDNTVGVAALQSADDADLPDAQSGIQLHGLYVDPDRQRSGIGGLLVQQALNRVDAQQLDGLLVKAQADAAGFFERLDFEPVPVRQPARDYPYRYWKSLA